MNEHIIERATKTSRAQQRVSDGYYYLLLSLIKMHNNVDPQAPNWVNPIANALVGDSETPNRLDSTALSGSWS